MSEIEARHPRAEADALLPAGHSARVLEPSPPANTDPDWYADDPTDPDDGEETVVTPIAAEGVLWDDIIDTHPELAPYASEHWLGAHHRLEALPAGFEVTRNALHQVAFFATAPKRYSATGKLGLRYTYRGFGTPFFGDDEQVRVEGTALVHQQGDQVSVVSVTGLAEACEFLGIPYREEWFEDFHDPLAPVGPRTPLDIDPDAVQAIGDWFGFATLVLERARRTPGAADVSRVQIWPEHFDSAVEMGSQARGHRASYGASPGDEDHPGPYLYVAAWGDIDRNDPFWDDDFFNGASLSYAELLDSEDQIATALDFFTRGYERLTISSQTPSIDA
jgi:hypothetical protein